ADGVGRVADHLQRNAGLAADTDDPLGRALTGEPLEGVVGVGGTRVRGGAGVPHRHVPQLGPGRRVVVGYPPVMIWDDPTIGYLSMTCHYRPPSSMGVYSRTPVLQYA